MAVVDEIVTAEVSVSSDDFALGRILRGPEDLRLDLAQFVPLDDQFVPYVWADTDDQRAFEERVRADERVADLTPLDTSETRTFYRIEWHRLDDHVMSAIAAYDLVIEDATGTCERWRFRLRGPDRGSLAAFQQDLLEEDIGLYIHRIGRPAISADSRCGLTEIQHETLEVAYREGYFSTPRDASLSDLGELLDVSHQSVSRRIRTGLENLLEGTLVSDHEPDRSGEASKEPV